MHLEPSCLAFSERQAGGSDVSAAGEVLYSKSLADYRELSTLPDTLA